MYKNMHTSLKLLSKWQYPFFQFALFFRSKFLSLLLSRFVSSDIWNQPSSSIRTWVHLEEAVMRCTRKCNLHMSERAFVILCCLTASYLAKEYIYIYISVSLSLSLFNIWTRATPQVKEGLSRVTLWLMHPPGVNTLGNNISWNN